MWPAKSTVGQKLALNISFICSLYTMSTNLSSQWGYLYQTVFLSFSCERWKDSLSVTCPIVDDKFGQCVILLLGKARVLNRVYE